MPLDGSNFKRRPNSLGMLVVSESMREEFAPRSCLYPEWTSAARQHLANKYEITSAGQIAVVPSEEVRIGHLLVYSDKIGVLGVPNEFPILEDEIIRPVAFLSMPPDIQQKLTNPNPSLL